MSQSNVCNLFDEQVDVLAYMLKHINDYVTDRPLILSAKAGSGKTHLARTLMQLLAENGINGSCIAPTGRAASQLRKSGVVSGTIHSLLYKAIIDPETGKFRFFAKRDIREIKEVAGDYIILDESSMVTFEQFDFMRSIGCPIICLGDARQLPPIDRKHPDFNLMELTYAYYHYLHINRRIDPESIGLYNVLESFLANGNILRFSESPKNVYRTLSKKVALSLDFHKENQFDAVICGLNKTRKHLNRTIRQSRGFDIESTPQVGEVVMCLKNDMVGQTKINNGELFLVESITRKNDQICGYGICNIDTGERAYISVYDSTWDSEELPDSHNWKDENNKVQTFGYGYCMTVHKSQGSGFDSVLFINEDVSFFVDQKKFAYVGLSRARKSLTVAL
jgi:exodeoxyribonuclease-5